MPFMPVGEENSGEMRLYYEDHGSGDPVVLIHGYPLSGASWEKQVPLLLNAGRRVITYDRRGFGRSSQPTYGYDYDTFVDDLNQFMTQLDLRNTTLIGFSMGTGEVAHYLGKYGSERVDKAVFIGVLPPFLLKTPDNPEGVDGDVFQGLKKSIIADRPSFLSQFFASFFNTDVYLGSRVSEEAVRMCWNVAAGASPTATFACVDTWLTDFRDDLPRIDVPSLIVHGDADRILPFNATAPRMQKAVKGSRLVVVKGGPHGIPWTHADEVNRALADFLELGAPRGVGLGGPSAEVHAPH